MKKLLALLFALSSSAAFAQSTFPTANGKAVESIVTLCVTGGVAAPCASPSIAATTTAIAGNASGSTAAVVGTLTGAASKTTFLCGLSIDSLGGVASTGPITVAGVLGGPMVFQLTSSATGTFRAQDFTPCIPSSAVNTPITITTTANGTATAVNVNSWGYRQ